jgi:hypothetical protein
MHAVLQINEVLAMIVDELRDSKASLAALSSTNQLFFSHARPILWEELPGYGVLASLMPKWSWRMEFEHDMETEFIVCPQSLPLMPVL